MNLKVMNTFKSSFGVATGISDHTVGLLVPLLAIISRANVIENTYNKRSMVQTICFQ